MRQLFHDTLIEYLADLFVRSPVFLLKKKKVIVTREAKE